MYQSTLILLTAATCKAVAHATVEFDLVFPRNETYAPTALMPVVFAFRNSPAWIPLIPILRWDMRLLPSGEIIDGDYINLSSGINADTDPYIHASSSLVLNAADGDYMVVWDLIYGNCTATAPEQYPGGNPEYEGLFLNDTSNHTGFRIRRGAQAADLAAQSYRSCPAEQGIALNVTATRTVDDTAAWMRHNVCGVLANPLPTPSPCALKFDAAMASSVEAALTASQCSRPGSNKTGIDCPPSPTRPNAGGRVLMNTGTACWTMIFWLAMLGIIASLLW